MGSRAVASAALAALIGLAALTGCGGSAKTTTTVVTAAGAGSAASVAQTSAADVVAMVERTPITKASFAHWASVTAALSHSKAHSGAGRAALKNQVLGFLITSQWVLGEAAHLGIGVSEAEVHGRLHQVTAKQFPTASQLKRYLASIGETEADLLVRVKVELLETKISQHVTAGKTASTEPRLLLSDFQKSFEARWRARTSCEPGYVMEDCREYKGTPHPPAASSSSSAATSSSSSSHATSTSANSNASGELPVIPGAMAISSPAFERNGTIPQQYTCDGANISPPLQWQHLPAHTKDLVLFVIDDSSDGAEGGIRWVVAGIEPTLSGISAGQLPSGAVVGLNGSGKATYGGICPPKGKPASIEFVLWALSKKIPLSSGFIPAVAEHDYSHSELASATTYASYSRP
jgi:Raf kinase inhibitor-like YbhB/YbcL family protein